MTAYSPHYSPTNHPGSYLLLAPPGSGKTHFCIQKIKECLEPAPFSPVWVIVRDRLQAAAFRRRLYQGGVMLGVNVTPFGDLYQEILARSGMSMPVAEEAALHRLLRDLLEEAYQQGSLVHYAKLRGLPGFVDSLRQSFAELKGALAEPEYLAALADAAADNDGPDQSSQWHALRELSRLYSAYQAKLQKLGWVDEEGLNWLGVEALSQQAHLLRDWRMVVVDGFDSFNPLQRRTVQLLSGRVQELWVTLPGQPGMERLAHRRFARSLQELQSGASFEIVSLPEDTHHLPEELAALEARMFQPPDDPIQSGTRVQMLEARSPDEEAREALRWLKARIVRDNLNPSDCALILPQFDVYRPAVLASAAEFGLPVRLSRGARLTETPPIAAMLDLLSLPLRGYPVRLLLETVRAPFLDLTPFGLRRSDAGVLETVARYGQVVEGLEQWQAALAELSEQVPDTPADQSEPGAPAQGEEETIEEETGPTAPALPRGQRAGELWLGLQALANCISPSDGEMSLEEWVRWLVALLEKLGFYHACSSQVEQSWLAGLDRNLGVLARSERFSLQSNGGSNYAAFLSALQSLLSAAGTIDDLPGYGEEEAIWVLHTFEARGLRFQAVALVGLAEGSFPALERADPLLPEHVRDRLGIDLRLGSEQAGIFYQLIARADQMLLLTRPYLVSDGEAWEPSPFWTAAREVLAGPVSRVRPEDYRPLADAASAEELLFWMSRRETLVGSAPEEPFAGRWPERREAITRRQRVLAARLDKGEASVYQGDLGQQTASLRERFGGIVWSASRLEGYATCPFFFYAGSALGLEIVQLPEPGLETYQLGSLLHEVLERVYQDCQPPREVEALLSLLPAVAETVFANAPQRYGFRPSLLWEMEKAELLEKARAAIEGLGALDQEAGWQPVDFECRFGIGEAPFLCITVDGQEVRLRGLIDRIDRDRHNNLRVVDYKSGSAHLSAKDLLDGRRLQLPLYAMAVEQALGLGRVVDGLYWKLIRGQPGSLRLARFRADQDTGLQADEGPQAAYVIARSHVARIVNAIQSGDFSPRPPDGGCPSYCPASSWCWSYRPMPMY